MDDIFDVAERFYSDREGSKPANPDGNATEIYNQKRPNLKPAPIYGSVSTGERYKPLTEKDRDVIVMVDVDGLQIGQVAEMLAIRPGKARERYYRARLKLIREASEYAEWIAYHNIDIDAWMEDDNADDN